MRVARWTVLALGALLAGAPFGSGQAADPGTPAAFRFAEGSRDWAFPRDHGQHPAYKLEWWYYTGILQGPDGLRLGFQVTFFRRGVTPEAQRRGSAWAARSLFAAQAALSVLEGPLERQFLHAGQSARESLGMAGASELSHRVWVRSWRADPLPGDPHGASLEIPAREFALSLALRPAREPVQHGQGGLDRKGEPNGQASWYYSLTRLRAEGTVTVRGRAIPVRGMAWMDHEFSSSQLGTDQAGWDWFGLRLSDGSDLMVYRLRRRDGTIDPFSGGTWVAPDGTAHPFEFGADPGAALSPTRHWRSPGTGAQYPVAWQIALPERELTLEVTPLAEAQELTPTRGIPFAYWEGAVSVQGTRAGRPVTGEGFLELTGYGGEVAATLR